MFKQQLGHFVFIPLIESRSTQVFARFGRERTVAALGYGEPLNAGPFTTVTVSQTPALSAHAASGVGKNSIIDLPSGSSFGAFDTRHNREVRTGRTTLYFTPDDVFIGQGPLASHLADVA